MTARKPDTASQRYGTHMTRTIRQHFQHRIRWIVIGIGLAWVLLPVAAVLTPDRHGGSRAVGVGLFALATCMVVGAIIALLRVHCPKCGGSLTHLGADLTFPIGRARVERCPHCSVSLDDPL